MVNVLQGMQYVQQQGELGRQRGTQNRLAGLASQAYGAAPDAQRGFVQQAIQSDPDAGFALNKQLGDDRGQRLQSMSQRARMLVAYAKAGNRQGVDSIYPQLAQEASQLGLGQNIPGSWDDSYLPGMEQLANIGSGAAGATVHSQKVGADGFIYNTMRDGSLVNTGIKADRQMWLRDHAGIPAHLVGKGGDITWVDDQQQGQQPGAQPPPQTPPPPGLYDTPNGQARIGAELSPEQWRAVQLDMANGGQSDNYQLPPRDLPPSQYNATQPRPQMPAQPQPQGGALAPPLNYTGGGLTRPSEAQTAAATEAAKLQTQLQYAPAMQQVETQGAVERARLLDRDKRQGDAQAVLGKVSQSASQMRSVIGQILDHPGLETATGLRGTVDPRNRIPGTDAYNARVLIEQLQGQAFLQAFESLKGGGPITDTEGAKATAAMARLNTGQSTSEYKRALRELAEVIDAVERRARENAGRETQQPSGGSSVLRYNPATGDFE